jgi:hypothetical protein
MKRQGAPALPTRTGGVQGTRRGGGRPEWYSVLGLSLLNVFLGVAIQAGVEFLFTEVLGIRSALKVTTTLPMPWSIAKEIVRSLLLREVRQDTTTTRVTADCVGGLSILHSPLPTSPVNSQLCQQIA